MTANQLSKKAPHQSRESQYWGSGEQSIAPASSS